MAEMNTYLDRMAAEILTVPIETRRLGAADASMHHRLVFLPGGLPGVVMENNVHIATMGLEPDETYRVGDDGLVRTADGHVPAILHQYDRVPAVQTVLACHHAWFAARK
jgi:hypothetical protein